MSNLPFLGWPDPRSAVRPEMLGWPLALKHRSFPWDHNRIATPRTTSDTSHTIYLPDGIAAGDILFAAISLSTNTVSHSWPADWVDLDQGSSTSARGGIAYKIASGTEGSSMTVTTSGSAQACAIVWRIGNAYPQAPVWTVVSSADPDPLTPGRGSLPTLWLATCIKNGTSGGLTYGPSGWDNFVNFSDGATNCKIAGATLQNLGSTIDPSSFASFGSNRSYTVAFLPIPMT